MGHGIETDKKQRQQSKWKTSSKTKIKMEKSAETTVKRNEWMYKL